VARLVAHLSAASVELACGSLRLLRQLHALATQHAGPGAAELRGGLAQHAAGWLAIAADHPRPEVRELAADALSEDHDTARQPGKRPADAAPQPEPDARRQCRFVPPACAAAEMFFSGPQVPRHQCE
jgi:hypothetical protein